jgi:capsular polysaccharide biosynthesis protein/exosome complex RNA-binding protein Csl4
VLLAAAVISAVTAYAASSRVTPTYEAETRLLTGPINADFDTIRASSQLAQTYGQLATSRRILAAVRNQLGLAQTVDDLAASVSATGSDITRLVVVRAKSDDPVLAARIANTIAARLAQETSQTPAPPAPAPTAGQLTIVDSATPPSAPVAPRVPLITALAAIAGLIGAAVLVLLLQSGRDTIEAEEDLAGAFVPLLGSVRRSPRTALVVQERPRSRTADEYRVVATKIELSATTSGARSVLVVGCDDGDGAGMVAANIAGALAESGSRITLVDANNVNAEITEVFGLNGQPGAGTMTGAGATETVAAAADAVELTASNGRLQVVPFGRERAAASDGSSVRGLLDRLSNEADLVVVNADAVESSASTLKWARATDATVLVVEQGRTKREALRNAVKTLALVEANVIGTVLTTKRSLLPLRPGTRSAGVRARSEHAGSGVAATAVGRGTSTDGD